MTSIEIFNNYKNKYRTDDVLRVGEVITIGKESFRYYLDNEFTNANRLRKCLVLEIDYNTSFAELIDANKTFLSTESLERYLISLAKTKIKDLKEMIKDYNLVHKKQKTEKLYKI